MPRRTSGPLAPWRSHHQHLALFIARFGGLSYAFWNALSVAVRLAGGAVAGFFERSLGLVSKNLGHAVASKIRSSIPASTPCAPLATLQSSAGMSLGMWLLITFAYFVDLQSLPRQSGPGIRLPSVCC
jgi:hypothetical protein